MLLMAAGPALAAPVETPGGAARPAGPVQQGMARIVLVGPVANERSLALLLEELLGHRGIQADIRRSESFDPDALFGHSASGETLVFISLVDAHNARLHFRAPSGDRFLLRRLELPNGVDPVGRELLGQVVESSVVALFDASQGLSRADVAAAIAQDAAETAAVRKQQTTPSSPSPTPPSEPTKWDFGVGATYSGEWSGSDLGLAHGPGVALGTRRYSALTFGVRLDLQRYFPQHLRTPLIHADIQRTVALASLEVGWAQSKERAIFAALGPAMEISRLTPFPASPDVQSAAAKFDVAPALRGQVSYEWAWGHWCVGAAAWVNVSLVDTHYDLVDDGTQRAIARLGGVRPGMTLSFTLR